MRKQDGLKSELLGRAPPTGGSGCSLIVLRPPSCLFACGSVETQHLASFLNPGWRPSGLSASIPHAASQPPAKFSHPSSRNKCSLFSLPLAGNQWKQYSPPSFSIFSLPLASANGTKIYSFFLPNPSGVKYW
jgi:hypothetical protein